MTLLPLFGGRGIGDIGDVADVLTVMVLMAMVSTPGVLVIAVGRRGTGKTFGARASRVIPVEHHHRGQPVR